MFPKYEPWIKPRVQRLIRFTRRAQGLIVAPGNPLGITSLADVAKTKARFINRQRGSGTHLALDKMLADAGIDKGDITGYYTEEFTHLAVAAAIAGGVADVGLGIEAAARKLKMDFIPLFHEEYYLLAKRETIEREDIQNIVAVLGTESFRKIVDAFPGYEESIISKTPLGRIAGPDEIATTVLFLLSGLSTYVDGATLVADGGWVAQ